MTALAKTTLGLGARPALLVVDASCAFTDPSSPLGADFADEIAAIGELMSLARDLGWTRWFSTVWYETSDEAALFREKVPALNGLVAGSTEVSIDARLPLAREDHVFRKTHASCFFGTQLNTELQSLGIDSLVVGGFTTSGCVRATAVDALQHGYRTVVVEDAVGDRDPDAHRANLYDIEAKYGDVCSKSELQARCVSIHT
jgi:maleamate amidohydrolase